MSVTRVRFGGQETPRGFMFELSGGHPALDFVNTLDERPADPPRERLRAYEDLLRFGRQSGVLDDRAARALARVARAEPGSAARALGAAIALRENLFRLLHSHSVGGRRDRDALEFLDRAARRAYQHRRLVLSSEEARWIWNDETAEAIVWRLADSAISLVTSDLLSRVRTCEGSGCLWLFLDMSRQRNRRWCDMTVCGNRAKARRHYELRRRGGE